jgi:serine/threonine-protein kinase PknG
MTCSEIGCDGEVIGGYCDVCGTAPNGAAPQSLSVPTAPTLRPSPHGRQPGNERSKSAGNRGRLGAGIVAVPRIPPADPLTAVLVDPRIPQPNRFCGNPECGRPVGRDQGGQPGRAQGFCTQCGTRYSFVPKLSRGELVGDQYEVQGCLAHGGLGWIYLAIDRRLHNRWVVLKGLVNSTDVDAMKAAEAEAQALSRVNHPNIVEVYNFVEHLDSDGVPEGYIVMEYIGGTSLKQIRQRNGPLAPDQAVAYIVEIAPALGYLHDQGYAYCDFKPDNMMHTDEQVKLIDLGAVVDMDDDACTIFGTPGYQAPEIAWGPTVATDVYTVGRTLAALVTDIPQQGGKFVDPIPGPDTTPLFAAHPSLYRAILRATDPEPAQRFSSMDELADQLTGVLHEIAAAGGVSVPPRKSNHFSPQRGVYGAGLRSPVDPGEVIAALSVPVVNPADPGAAILATTSGTPPAQLESALALARTGAHHGAGSSIEVSLRLVRAALEMGAPAEARERLAELAPRLSGDWRVPWYRGQCALLEHDYVSAAEDFDSVLAVLPGELPPKVALAAAAELRGDHHEAERYYRTVWRTDDGYVSAAFGLARQRVRADDLPGAVAALDRVPDATAHATPAGATAIEILLDRREADGTDEDTLLDAERRLSRLNIESPARHATIRLQIFTAALDWLHAGNSPTAAQLLGVEFDERGVRLGMERCYRTLARDASDMWERIALVQSANTIRPRTRI